MPGWKIRKEFKFEAAHSLPLHDGKCRRLHGHSYRVIVEIASADVRSEGPKTGMVCDFATLSDVVKPIIATLDHYNLNHVTPVYTTAENLAKWLFEQIVDCSHLEIVNGLQAVEVYETATSMARYER